MSETETLEQVLENANITSTAIALPEKLRLARLLARAVLRFHATLWLNREWQSKDVVFCKLEGGPLRSAHAPYLKARVNTPAGRDPRQLPGIDHDIDQANPQSIRTPIRNRMIFNLGVMLVELAYDSPLQELQLPEDDQGDPHTLY